VHPMPLQFQNILYKIVEIQMHYWLIMRNWSLGCTSNNISILWYLPTPNLLGKKLQINQQNSTYKEKKSWETRTRIRVSCCILT
jgi:hypothetical protein